MADPVDQRTTEPRLHILVVDDDEVDRLAVRRGLRRAGLNVDVQEAASALEALQRIEPAAYDCIFLDYNIPGGDGLTLLKGIRHAGISIPVVMLTGHGDEQVAVELMKAGAVDYLPKAALTPERLASSLRYAVELSRVAAARARAEQELRETAQRNALLFEEAQHARADAEAANRAKSEFLARMSHDLRTPLNAIGGYAQLVEVGAYGPATDGQLDAMRRIRRAQEHLLTLINDILSFAKLEAGQVHLDIQTLRGEDVLSGIRELVEPQVIAKGLHYESECGDGEVRFRADRDRLAQILLNLTSNAVKFTDRGTVTVGCHPDGNRVRLYVRDTGRGIPRDRLLHVFDPFVQAGRSAEERNQGVGLGLAISRELARLMGGELSVESIEGQGSTFWVELERAL